jgi:hypothetical protein
MILGWQSEWIKSACLPSVRPWVQTSILHSPKKIYDFQLDEYQIYDLTDNQSKILIFTASQR